MTETARCRCCGLTRPLSDLFVPDGSLVIDTSPPIYEYLCVNRERCQRDRDAFDGCTIACRRKAAHTPKWGECDNAEEPPRKPPEFGFWRAFTAEDGHDSIGMASIPLLAILPWVKYLSVDEQYRMLEEVSDAEDPAACVRSWWAKTLPAQLAEAGRPEVQDWEAFRRHEEAKRGVHGRG